MNISYLLAEPSDYKVFYKAFIKSLKKQFPEYNKNSMTYLTEVDWSWKRIINQLKVGKKIAFLAKEEKAGIVGYILFNKNYGGVSLINWIAVEEKYQQHGIATNLLEIWEKDALKKGAHALQVWTVEKRRSFYKNRGFVESGTLPSFWFGIDHYLFYKIIGKPIEKNYLKEFLENK